MKSVDIKAVDDGTCSSESSLIDPYSSNGEWKHEKGEFV